MPFTTTQNLPSDPLVTVKFSGLLVLKPGANETCDVGVHNFNRSHVFQVILVVSKPNQAPTLIPLLSGPLQAPLSIRLRPEPGVNDFKVFEKDPFTRAFPESDPHDARWAVNLQTPDKDVRVNEGAMPFATLKTGVLFSPSLSDTVLTPKFTCPPGAQVDLKHFAPELSAAIAPPPDTKVVLEWMDFGSPVERELPLAGDDPATTRYTIYFINEPPNFNSEPHDELALYYRVLRRNGATIPDEDQCKLKVNPAARLDQIPCNPVRLDP